MSRKLFHISTAQFLKLALVVSVILLGWWFSFRLMENERVIELVERYGYLGIFVIAIVSGFNLIIPVPAISFLPLYVASGLETPLVFLTISVGITVADIVGYYIGYFGRVVVSEDIKKTIQKLEKWRERNPARPYVVLFFFATFAPLPNEILVIPMGFLGYRLAYIIPIVFTGNLIFNFIYGFGLVNVLNILF